MVSSKRKKRDRKRKIRVPKSGKRTKSHKRKHSRKLRKASKAYRKKRVLHHKSSKGSKSGKALVTSSAPNTIWVMGRLANDALSNNNGMYYATAADLPDFANYAAMYAEYRIVDLTMIFQPCYAAKETKVAGDTGSGDVIACRYFAAPLFHEQDRVLTPYDTCTNSKTEICRLNNLHIFSSKDTMPTIVSVAPQVATALTDAGGGALTGAGLITSPWISVEDVTIAHNGIMFVPDVDPVSSVKNYATTDVVGVIHTIKRVTFEFRGKH